MRNVAFGFETRLDMIRGRFLRNEIGPAGAFIAFQHEWARTLEQVDYWLDRRTPPLDKKHAAECERHQATRTNLLEMLRLAACGLFVRPSA